jgi:hypothetical protein
VIVRNVNGTSASECACGSWLAHWAKFSGIGVSNYCPEVNCVSRAEVGAHVQKADPSDDGWYIVPLCRAHASQIGQELTLGEGTRLVSADVSQTCGR